MIAASRFATELLIELAQVDTLFAFPCSSATRVEDVFIDPAIGATHVGLMTPADISADAPETRRRLYRSKAGEDIFVFENDDSEIWFDVSRLREGQAGNRCYAAIADLARNTGCTFIGDPEGLSDIALRRRTDAMLSSALKHGTTDHLAPHERQLTGDKALGVPPLQWTR